MLAGQRKWLLEPTRFLPLWLRIAVALARCAMESALRLSRRVWRRVFLVGDGDMVDPAHGGLLTHPTVSERVVAEVEQQGFQFLRLAGEDYPRRGRAYVAEWCYIFRKAETSVSAQCA
jgi:hypothetical protein